MKPTAPLRTEQKLGAMNKMYDPGIFSKNQSTIVAEIARREALRIYESFYDNVMAAVIDMMMANNKKIEEDLENLGILPREEA